MSAAPGAVRSPERAAACRARIQKMHFPRAAPLAYTALGL